MVKSGNVVPCKYVSASSLAPNLIRKVIFICTCKMKQKKFVGKTKDRVGR